jgi:DNA-3-methyladenine glycosylase II
MPRLCSSDRFGERRSDTVLVMAGRIGYRAAAQLLAERDPVLARLVADAGLPRVPVVRETHFATLVRSIVYQQLATAAARAIHGRVIAALADDVTPERVLATAPEVLRAAGLSGRKVESLHDLATKVLDGTVILDPRRLARLSDEEITARLTTVKGIGKWSADIFLMFRLRRMDVWPTGDLAVRRGFGLAWAIPEPTEKQLVPLGEPYRPYRSVVAWYCWQAVRLYGKTAVTRPESAAGVV